MYSSCFATISRILATPVVPLDVPTTTAIVLQTAGIPWVPLRPWQAPCPCPAARYIHTTPSCDCFNHNTTTSLSPLVPPCPLPWHAAAAAAAVATVGQMPDVLINLANCHLARCEYADAVHLYRVALEKLEHRHHSPLLLYLARALYDSNKLPEAQVGVWFFGGGRGGRGCACVHVWRACLCGVCICVCGGG